MRNFAYGSNKREGGLKERVPDAEFLHVARLPGHDLRFHKRSRDGSGKCDAFQTGDPEDEVWGLIVDVPDDQRPSLDAAEGLNSGSRAESVAVFASDGQPKDVVVYRRRLTHQTRSNALLLVSEACTRGGSVWTFARLLRGPHRCDTLHRGWWTQPGKTARRCRLLANSRCPRLAHSGC